MDRRNIALRAYAMLGLTMLFWAGNSIVGRAVRHDIPPFTLAFVRWLGAFLILLPFAGRTAWAQREAILRGWWPILMLGLFGVSAFNGFIYVGLRHTTATNALLLQAMIPALVLLLDRLIFHMIPGRAQIAGVLVATIGVALIVFRADPAELLAMRLGAGDLLVLCAVLAWAFYTVMLRKKPAIDPFAFILCTFIIGVVTMAPLAASEWHEIEAIRWRPGVIGAFAYVAILPSLIAYILFNRSVEMVGPAKAGQAIALMPLFGALLAALLLGEPLHAYHIAGMLLILGGIVVGAAASRRPITS